MSEIMMARRLLVAISAYAAVGASAAWATPAQSEDPVCVTAAAEAFELLTENAANAPLARLLVESRTVTATAQECARTLAGSVRSQVDQVIAGMDRFGADRNRAALALNAVEGYRIFASAQPRGANDVPLEVSLLDYAGFRYQAAVHASPILWSEMSNAVDFADQQWRAVSGRIADSKLRSSFMADLAAMRSAVQAANATRAKRVVAAELQRVDALEQFFAKHR